MFVIGYETYLRKPTNDGIVNPGAMYYLGEVCLILALAFVL